MHGQRALRRRRDREIERDNRNLTSEYARVPPNFSDASLQRDHRFRAALDFHEHALARRSDRENVVECRNRFTGETHILPASNLALRQRRQFQRRNDTPHAGRPSRIGIMDDRETPVARQVDIDLQRVRLRVHASRAAARVFSGASYDAPRCAMISIRRAEHTRGRSPTSGVKRRRVEPDVPIGLVWRATLKQAR